MDTVADKPASVVCVYHLTRGFMAVQNGPLNHRSKVVREDSTLERKREEPEHLAVLVQGAQNALALLAQAGRTTQNDVRVTAIRPGEVAFARRRRS